MMLISIKGKDLIILILSFIVIVVLSISFWTSKINMMEQQICNHIDSIIEVKYYRDSLIYEHYKQCAFISISEWEKLPVSKRNALSKEAAKKVAEQTINNDLLKQNYGGLTH